MLIKGEMKRIFLGYKSKKLDNYKKEVDRIHICMVCGSEIVESGSYAELGHIARRKFEVRPGWYYQFFKLCPVCFGEVHALLRRIRKESKKKGEKMVPEQTIVEKVVEAHKSNDLTPLISWLERLGCTDITRDSDTATLTGLTGMRAGFTLGDPITLAVCTGFALFGPHWASVCPTLLEKVNKVWKAEMKKTKGGVHAKD